ncbi:hypothetical protein LTR37_004107 [Vermiconidia calcicola]|uniref:Uncharacterized protein n=1 Tax=Vermiconidia calcicola TaxID=1690605 RepID=A0ACC3NPG9_9PEZI|nr:hypothetical protein LTR37_004107 [Vermiconidia calcicola]
MPKKRTFQFKPLQGAFSSSSKQNTNKDGDYDSSPSVNERLSELRKIEGKDAAARKRQLAESLTNSRSVPPELRGILGISESALPKPKTAVRARERMRTPGPPPPKSWLSNGSSWTSTLASRGARRGLRRSADVNDRSRPKQLMRFARLAGLSDVPDGGKPSRLALLALKRIAQSWDLLEEEDYPALVEVPLRLRLRLISYISFYGLPLDYRGLHALLQGSETVHYLDLAGLVGHGNLTMKKLVKLLGNENESKGSNAEAGVAEAWDADETFEAALKPSPSLTRFSNLTHLCLSHPAPNVYWRDLLALVKHTAQVTHLSLAYWPRPTLTPNLATATVLSQNSPGIAAGGSHYYSALDQDMSEPASLLRQLSSHLLCLRWLDLEGCQEWSPALKEHTKNGPAISNATETSPDSDAWEASRFGAQSVVLSNWKNLRYIRLAQGWLPSLIGIKALQERHVSYPNLMADIARHLLESAGSTFQVIQTSQDVLDVEKKKARMWLECEERLSLAGHRIQSARRILGFKPATVDYEWMQR